MPITKMVEPSGIAIVSLPSSAFLVLPVTHSAGGDSHLNIIRAIKVGIGRCGGHSWYGIATLASLPE